MAFEPGNQLERSLVRAADDPAARPQFYRDLVESDVFVIDHGPPPARSGRTVLEEDLELLLQPLEIDGKPYLPIFSSLPRLQAVLREEAGYIAMNARQFFEITRGADLVLNPGSEYGKELVAAEIASLLDGSIWKPTESFVAKKDTEVLIGPPARYPTELAEALTRLYRKRREVKRAWLAHFDNPERDEQAHTLIALEVSRNGEEIAAETGLVAQSVPVPDPPVDLVLISGGGGIADYFLEEAEPFYERKLFGFG